MMFHNWLTPCLVLCVGWLPAVGAAEFQAGAAVREIAEELVKLYAARLAARAFACGPDSPWQADFEDRFPYDETPDQLEAVNSVKADLERDHPMERLVCGDVGFGKTEVARSLANNPAIILADEPTGNLDSANGRTVIDLLCALNRDQGRTVVIATHSRLADAVATQRLVLKDGALVEDAWGV